jgi:hypothetical protein
MPSAFQFDATTIKSLHPTKYTHKELQLKHLPAIHYSLKPQTQDSALFIPTIYTALNKQYTCQKNLLFDSTASLH